MAPGHWHRDAVSVILGILGTIFHLGYYNSKETAQIMICARVPRSV